jgi:tetrahydromethanopterin S-methyltransferase subunit F
MRDIETMERVRQLANVAGMMVQETRLASGLAGAGTMGLATLL